ncbi:MAG: threonine synthase, partial [Acidimicrobiia bacterium]
SGAFGRGEDFITPVRPRTIAKSLAIGNPADGGYALDEIRRSGGGAESATDDEIREGIKLLARTEGIFAETAGGATIAVLEKLVQKGTLDPGDEIVAVITGIGLKTVDAVAPTLETAKAKPNVESVFEALDLGKDAG